MWPLPDGSSAWCWPLRSCCCCWSSSASLRGIAEESTMCTTGSWPTDDGTIPMTVASMNTRSRKYKRKEEFLCVSILNLKFYYWKCIEWMADCDWMIIYPIDDDNDLVLIFVFWSTNLTREICICRVCACVSECHLNNKNTHDYCDVLSILLIKKCRSCFNSRAVTPDPLHHRHPWIMLPKTFTQKCNAPQAGQ